MSGPFDWVWTKQPQVVLGVDRSNQFGARTRFLFNPASGAVDVVTGTLAVNGGVTKRGTALGLAHGAAGVNPGAIQFPPNPTYAQFQKTTIFCHIKSDGLGGNAGYVISRQDGSSGSSWGLGIHTGSFNGVRIDIFGATSGHVLGAPVLDVGATATSAYRFLILSIDGVAGTYEVFADGVSVGTGAGLGAIQYDRTDLGIGISVDNTGGSSQFSGDILLAGVLEGTTNLAQAKAFSANPWQLFAPLRRPWDRPAPPASVTVYYPGSDISAGGWISSTGGSLASCVDETPYDDADYITSPDLSTSATLAWQSPIPAGTWDIAIRGAFLGASGQVRLVLLDAGGSTVGTSSWQTLTGSLAPYTLTVTTSGTSTKFRYEVQP